MNNQLRLTLQYNRKQLKPAPQAMSTNLYTNDARDGSPLYVSVADAADTLMQSEQKIKSLLRTKKLAGEKFEGEWLVRLSAVLDFGTDYRTAEKMALYNRISDDNIRLTAALKEQGKL